MAFSFELTYAGVGFCLDDAAVFRMEPRGRLPQAGHEPVRRYQPATCIRDEIERRFPDLYRQDIDADPLTFRERDSLASPRAEGQDHLRPRLGDWYYPTSASSWSVFRGWASSTQVKAMVAATGGSGPSEFVMASTPTNDDVNARHRVESDLYMLPPRPLGEDNGGEDGLYLVTLVDERYYWRFRPCRLEIRRGVTWASAIETVRESLGITLTVPAVPEVYTAPEPDSQLWNELGNPAALLDALASNVGLTVVRKLTGAYELMDYAASAALARSNRNDALRALRPAGGQIFSSGGQGIVAGNLMPARNAVAPASVRVSFPAYVVTDDPVPHSLNARTNAQRPSCWWEDTTGGEVSMTVPISSGNAAAPSGYPVVGGLSGTGVVTLYSLAKAYLSGEQNFKVSGLLSGGYPLSGFDLSGAVSGALVSGTTPVSGGLSGRLLSGVSPISGVLSGHADVANLSGLTSLAVALAGNLYASQAGFSLDEAYAGIFAWEPEGIHDVIWTYSDKGGGAITRATRPVWNRFPTRFQHTAPASIPAYSGIAYASGRSGYDPLPPKGVGGPSVAQSWRSFSHSGAIQTVLSETLLSGAMVAAFIKIDHFPTQNRWRGTVGAEAILFEGTSGGFKVYSGSHITSGLLSGGFPISGIVSSGSLSGSVISGTPSLSGLMSGTFSGEPMKVGIVHRGIDGTVQREHRIATPISMTYPQAQYGVNVLTVEKMQYAFPQEWTSGGLMGVNIVPQTQTVRVLCESGEMIDTIEWWSGSVRTIDLQQRSGSQFAAQELVWVSDRNGRLLRSGFFYDGQFAGFTCSGMSGGGYVRPGYVITETPGFTGPVPVPGDIYCDPVSGLVVTWETMWFRNGLLQSAG